MHRGWALPGGVPAPRVSKPACTRQFHELQAFSNSIKRRGGLLRSPRLLFCSSFVALSRPPCGRCSPLAPLLRPPRTPCSPLMAPLQPSRDLLVGKPGVNSGKCTIIGGLGIKHHKLHRAETELTWAFTEDSFQVGTDSPKTPPKYRLRPPNIVDLPEFEGRFPTSTSYSSRFCAP